EQPALTAGDDERVDLPPELTGEFQQNGAEPVRKFRGIDGGDGSGHIVNQVNESAAVAASPVPRTRVESASGSACEPRDCPSASQNSDCYSPRRTASWGQGLSSSLPKVHPCFNRKNTRHAG